jgi:GT2 family glycosyltransferase
MKSKVSCIICHHTGDLVNRCLKSLEGLDVEKIVITSDMNWQTKDNKVKVRRTRINEPTHKRNIGSFIATGKYLCYLDDDIEVDAYCIERMADVLDKNGDIGMVYATLLKMDNHKIIDTSGSFLSWSGFLYETYVKRDNELLTPILSAKSACCMIRNDLFFRIGCFDKDYIIYGEETDLSWRVWQVGYKVVISNDAIAYHAFETPLKPKTYYNQTYIHYNGCKNYITTLIKNLPLSRMYIVGINFMVWLFVGCCLWFKNRQGGKLIFKGLWYNIANFGYIWNKRIKKPNHYYWKLVRKDPPLSYYFGRFGDYLRVGHHG